MAVAEEISVDAVVRVVLLEPGNIFTFKVETKIDTEGKFWLYPRLALARV